MTFNAEDAKQLVEAVFPRKQPILIPMPGRIVVEALKEEMTPSGLYLPTNSLAEQRATVGRIIALPPEEPLDMSYEVPHPHTGMYRPEPERLFSIGDIILFGINSGMNVDVGYGHARRRAVILRESEVLCKVVDGEGKPYA
jgi:co-chaperonin GroES (HSP10)